MIAVRDQVPDLFRDDGESPSRFARAGRLDGRVQRKQVCLFRHGRDGLQNGRNSGRAFGEKVNGLNEASEGVPHASDMRHRFGDVALRRFGAVFEAYRVFGHGRRHGRHVLRSRGDGGRRIGGRVDIIAVRLGERPDLSEGVKQAEHGVFEAFSRCRQTAGVSGKAVGGLHQARRVAFPSLQKGVERGSDRVQFGRSGFGEADVDRPRGERPRDGGEGPDSRGDTVQDEDGDRYDGGDASPRDDDGAAGDERKTRRER